MKNKIIGEYERRENERKRQEEAAKSASSARYYPKYADMARRLIVLEQNQKQIAEFLGVSESTISVWKNKHPEFRRAIEYGLTELGVELVGTAHKLATGKYKHTDKRLVYDKKTGELATVDFGGTLEPSERMLEMLLKKKFPTAFPEKQEIAMTHESGIDVSIRVVGND